MCGFTYILFGMTCVFRIIHCFEQYQHEIPNGFNVPNPCDPTGIWNGVGHNGPEGQGNQNQFGKDFLAAGRKWTEKLCKADSDGDGMMNGYELGDPWCRWKKETPTSLLPAQHHPGEYNKLLNLHTIQASICEPWDTEECQRHNGSIVCPDHLKCAAAYEPHVGQVSARLPLTVVPRKEFTYACMVFNLPTKRTYHMVEAKPIFYNRRVLHHMTLYACDPKFTVRVSGKPFECPKVTTAPCQRIITSYNPKFPITCLHDQVGIHFGKDGIKQLVIQVLWNNPSGLAYEDSSGMAVYMTPNLRPNVAGFATIDSTVFQIPPGMESYLVMGGCPGKCTNKRITKEVYIAMGINLMHKLGKNQRVELIRNNTIIHNLTRSDDVDPNRPDVFRHIDPVRVLPGDSIRMICEFNSTQMTSPVNRGLSPEEEICRAQLMYYPKENWVNPTCLGYKHVPLCLFETVGEAMNCNYQSFLDSLQKEAHFNTTIATCGLATTCSAACLHLVSKDRQHPCLRGELYELWKSELIGQPDEKMKNLYKALVPCEKLYEQNAHLVPSRGRTAP
ncbi:DBH-like monooxygenase protein 1 [Ylistrum balloti]|uniref:DBH-like monooxygenase protein 1 n=1 Tax=Ylistrum balloti TaxID=509963 RepID=UPI002905CA71|nr:DBH-like monooxygenase protein 1 [Ylistrum balloti]